MKAYTLLCLALFAGSPASAMQRDGSAMLERADSNGDGAISRAEYQASRLAQFERLDRNGDGSITRSDFQRLSRFRPEAARRIEAMIAQADSNRDGRLTRAELGAAPMPLFDRADANGDGRIEGAERSELREARERRR